MSVQPNDVPNILWVYMDDVNPWMPCYGDTTIETPAITRLASRGTCFERMYSTAPVCSPSRSAVITGMYQTAIRAHNHYSSYERWRGIEMDEWDPNHLGIRTIPEIFRSAGYYTFNEGKNHYNFVDRDEQLYDRHTGPTFERTGENRPYDRVVDTGAWAGGDSDRPFFGQIQLPGGKATIADDIDRVSPAEVTVPPYYPDHPIFREEIAHHYDCIQQMDRELDRIIGALKRDGRYENTIVWFFSDHGMRLPRHKQFCYEGGINVPAIVAGPGVPQQGNRSDLTSGIDIGPTCLSLAGIDIPGHQHGQNVFDPSYHRSFVVGARDRCDYTIDCIRAVVTDRYKYIRNYMTDRPYLQPQYRDGRESIEFLKSAFADGKLNDIQARFVEEDRPAEELYDLVEDPHETRNLVHSTERQHEHVLAELRDILRRWIVDTDDQGQFPESVSGRAAVVQRWGDDAVDPRFDHEMPGNEH